MNAQQRTEQVRGQTEELIVESRRLIAQLERVREQIAANSGKLEILSEMAAEEKGDVNANHRD